MCLTRLSVVFITGLLAANPVWTQASAGETFQPGASAEAESSTKWRFSLRPYLFLSGVSGSVTAGPFTFPINSSFSDLLDNVQLGGFVAFTAEKGQWGLYTDFQYISLIGIGTSALDAELELDNLIAEADVTYRPASAPTLKFLAGLRVYSIEQSVSILSQPLPKANTTVLDPIFGAQGEWALSERWDFEIRGDIGGFGISSEFTYQLMALFHWDLSSTVSIPFGYRILGYQIKTDEVWMKTQMGGLVLGLDIRF
jgi:hypothetical protein